MSKRSSSFWHRIHGVAQPSVPSALLRHMHMLAPILRRTHTTIWCGLTPCRFASATQHSKSLPTNPSGDHRVLMGINLLISILLN